MTTLSITAAPVHQIPSDLPTERPDRGEWAHPLTGQRMSAWAPARSTREEDRRETVLSGRIAASDLGPAGRAYAREMVEAGDCGYRSAIAQAREIFATA